MELAEAYEISDDGLTVTFNLRKGVKFHDLSEVKAEDVKYTIDRMLVLKRGIYRILSSITGAEVLDDYTVAFKLEQPFPFLLHALTSFYIVNADVVKKHEEGGDWGEKWLVEHEAGSGPYTLISWEREQQFVFEKFPEYFKGWDKQADRVVFRIISEMSARRLALEAGDVDYAAFDADIWEALEDVPGVERYTGPRLNQLYIALNTTNEHLKDPRVRRALALSYDYVGHVEVVRRGHGLVARGPFPPAIPCFDESMKPSEMNIEKAKGLMVEAGYPEGGFELTLAYQGTDAEEVAIVQILQAGAAELGITVKPMAMEWPAKVEAFSSEETAPDMGTIWSGPAYADPYQYLHPLGYSENAGTGGLNFAYYSNDRMDKLLDAARTETDQDKRCELYKEAQQLWVEDAPYLNLIVGVAMSAGRDYLKNYTYGLIHTCPLVYDMYLEGKPEK